MPIIRCGLKNQVGNIVRGKLANFTILATSLLQMDPMKIKDIAVWRMFQEGRVLAIHRVTGNRAFSVLGHVLDEPTLAAVQRAEAAVAGHEHGGFLHEGHGWPRPPYKNSSISSCLHPLIVSRTVRSRHHE
jgi:hypothetical protein